MLKTIDLFAGAGGLSYGFESTREFLIVAAAENNKNARKTYVENHKGRNDIRLIPDVRDYDFSALASEFDGIDVVIGGPPCQGFSNANRQKNHIKVFVKVKSWLINLLSGVTEIEIYKVSDVTNRQLRFNRMREYLIDHIGEYVFSRANVSEIIFIQIVELVGRTNKQLFLKNSLKINRMLYYMKIKTKSSRYKMWQQKEYYQLY